MTSELVNAEVVTSEVAPEEANDPRAHERIASYCHIKYD